MLANVVDPVWRWYYPVGTDYLKHFRSVANAYAGKAFDGGTAYQADDYSGVALWLPPGVSPDEHPLMDLVESTFEPRKYQIVVRVIEQMGISHPTEPHWFLPLTGVDPRYQGIGIGSALMKTMTKRFDQEGRLAYLESSNPRNLAFYERFGFAQCGTIQVDECPPLAGASVGTGNESTAETWRRR